MKAAPDLPLQLVNTLRVIGLRAEALKAILSDMPACERPVADTVLNQLEDTLVVVETAWTLLSGLPGEAPLEPPKRLLN